MAVKAESTTQQPSQGTESSLWQPAESEWESGHGRDTHTSAGDRPATRLVMRRGLAIGPTNNIRECRCWYSGRLPVRGRDPGLATVKHSQITRMSFWLLRGTGAIRPLSTYHEQEHAEARWVCMPSAAYVLIKLRAQ
eukprot:CAMPEP_0119467492 /NCGR_PEP_ID=MMETSP1344-20130328/1656_1 /TAXON_ID=236787 /ORGANISM="Florenciella parvula, Strain CCMP2471" /LENGTH=136 /DNA_ID=CAMNT_0007499863 /DNA_START=62 /DNA_END=473 /DNA_ORIENTATION=-